MVKSRSINFEAKATVEENSQSCRILYTNTKSSQHLVGIIDFVVSKYSSFRVSVEQKKTNVQKRTPHLVSEIYPKLGLRCPIRDRVSLH